MIASKGDRKMSRRQTKMTGWAAFDQQQKQKGVSEPRLSNEPFPSLPSASTTFEKPETHPRNIHFLLKPFSSVVMPTVDSPSPVLGVKNSKPSKVVSSGACRSAETSGASTFIADIKKLREVYSWADDSLIRDVMAAVGNDFDMASSVFESMKSDDWLEKHEDAKAVKSICDSMELGSNGKTVHSDTEIPVQAVSGSAKINENRNSEDAANAEKCFNDCMENNNMLGELLTCVPVEPEWEEDDVYLSCRKDAVKMMRAATRHSKAAANSFLRGDRLSAQQYSAKAQEDWELATKLNAKAAREILKIRNENNGTWRLDLHGLHASEAVQALQEHLHMIETQLHFKGSSPAGIPIDSRTKAEASHASAPSSFNNMHITNEQAFYRQNPKWLEVITGIGNHSRGGAALPSAIRTFIVNNGYRFDEARPGVIMVRPKFRSS